MPPQNMVHSEPLLGKNVLLNQMRPPTIKTLKMYVDKPNHHAGRNPSKGIQTRTDGHSYLKPHSRPFSAVGGSFFFFSGSGGIFIPEKYTQRYLALNKAEKYQTQKNIHW
jgi:hypothetical protein